MIKRPAWKKSFIVFFVLLNAFSVLYANRPPFISNAYSNLFYPESRNYPVFRAWEWIVWAYSWYPHIVGIDQVYTMFSTVHRRVDYFLYSGYDGIAQKEIPLPIELTPGRTWYDRHIFDHKAAKFHLNMYPSSEARRNYARYLCDEWAHLAAYGFERVFIRHYFRMLPPPHEGRRVSFELTDPSDGLFSTEAQPCR